jgi:hypothetical protein
MHLQTDSSKHLAPGQAICLETTSHIRENAVHFPHELSPYDAQSPMHHDLDLLTDQWSDTQAQGSGIMTEQIPVGAW